MRARNPFPIVLPAVVAASAVLVGCGTDDTTSDGAVTETTVESTVEPAVLRIAASDYEYGGVPETVEAGTQIQLENVSEIEAHELVAIRLPDDENRAVDELVRLPPAELGALFPLVETVVIAAPGEAGVVVEGNGALDEPGRYALICVIPTGADPAAYLAAAAEADGGPPEVAGGPPHIVQGMFAELTVE